MTCWVEGAAGSAYDVDNLPYGVFSADDEQPRGQRLCVAVVRSRVGLELVEVDVHAGDLEPRSLEPFANTRGVVTVEAGELDAVQAQAADVLDRPRQVARGLASHAVQLERGAHVYATAAGVVRGAGRSQRLSTSTTEAVCAASRIERSTSRT